MEMNKRHPLEAFADVRKTRLSQDAKLEIALGAYLALEALNETAPRGCDGMPMDLMVDASVNGSSVQGILRKILTTLNAPIPPDPEPEFQEGRCGCGDKLTSELLN